MSRVLKIILKVDLITQLVKCTALLKYCLLMKSSPTMSQVKMALFSTEEL